MLITRSIAILPALVVTFLNKDNLTNMDNLLNILQSVILPFALVPLLKFIGHDKVMGDFAIKGWAWYFASLFGVCLFSFNFVVLFTDVPGNLPWWNYLLIGIAVILYMGFLMKAMCEPVGDLKPITKEEEDDHEYDRILIHDGAADQTA